MALGAGRGALVRQALTESVLLALTGGAAGCALAFALLRVVHGDGPGRHPAVARSEPRPARAAVHLRGIAGLRHAVRPGFRRSNGRESRRLAPDGRPRAADIGCGRRSVAAQICVSLVLLTGAGLLLRRLWNLQNQPLGIRTEGAITAAVTLGRTAYARARQKRQAFFEVDGSSGCGASPESPRWRCRIRCRRSTA